MSDMILRNFLFILLPCLLLVTGGCSDNDLAGDVDDTGNFLTGVIKTTNGFADRCTVSLQRVVITDHGDSITDQRSTVTDHDGNYIFSNVSTGSYTITAFGKNSEKGAITGVRVDSDSRYPIKECVIGPVKNLSGRIVISGSSSSTYISIPGVTKTIAEQDGFFVLDGVPPGFFDIAIVNEHVVNYVPIMVNNVTQDTAFVKDILFARDITDADRTYGLFETRLSSTFSVVPAFYPPEEEPSWYTGKDFSLIRYFRVETDSTYIEIDNNGDDCLLLDNFDSGNKFTMLYPTFENSYWFAYNDVSEGGNSVVEPAGMIGNFALGITKTEAYAGNSVSCRFILMPGAPSPYANIGVSITDSADGWSDLTSMTSLSFYARGKGTMSIRFISKKVESYAVDTWGHLGKFITLSQNWEKHTVNISEIIPPTGSQQEIDGLSWLDVRDSIKTIVFGTWRSVTGDTLTMQLDEIYLNGVTLKDLK